MTPVEEAFMHLAYMNGGKFRERILASAEKALAAGCSPQYVCDCLLRNCADLWDRREALRRQRKAILHRD